MFSSPKRSKAEAHYLLSRQFIYHDRGAFGYSRGRGRLPGRKAAGLEFSENLLILIYRRSKSNVFDIWGIVEIAPFNFFTIMQF